MSRQATTIIRQVARGAALLGKHELLWFTRIDEPTLDLESCENCVLGQLAYEAGRTFYSRFYTSAMALFNFRRQLIVTQRFATVTNHHGFYPSKKLIDSNGISFWESVAGPAWLAEIRKRKDALWASTLGGNTAVIATAHAKPKPELVNAV